jgi:hypothetical protein
MDVPHFLGTAINLGQQLPQWHNYIHPVHRRAHRVRQQWAENQVIFPVEEHDFGVVPGQIPEQSPGAFYSAKAPAYDDNTLFFHSIPIGPRVLNTVHLYPADLAGKSEKYKEILQKTRRPGYKHSSQGVYYFRGCHVRDWWWLLEQML